MSYRHLKYLGLKIVALLVVSSCDAPESVHLDSGDEILIPQNVQNILTNKCAFTGCHAGSKPAQGLDLSQKLVYKRIVNVPSKEKPDILLISPGMPDNSYLVSKIEGIGIEGERMPAGGPYLIQTDINIIRNWVQNDTSFHRKPTLNSHQE